MNSYVICPDNSTYLDPIKEYACRGRHGRGRRPSGAAEPKAITSQPAFDAETFKDRFSSPAATDTIFIVPELGWGDDLSPRPGYQLAVELITKKLAADSFVNILFVSQYTREQLMAQLGESEYVGLVQSFPHITIDDILDSQEAKTPAPVPVPFYSPIHFEMLRRVVVSKSGKLDFIKHKLAHLTRIEKGDPEKEKAAIKSAKERLAGFLNLLSLPSYCDKDSPLFPIIQQYQKSLDKADSKEAIHELETGVRNLIDDIRTQMLKDTAASPNESDQVYKILVVDDDAFFREKMKEFFKKYLGPKTEVFAYDNAQLRGGSIPGGQGDAVKDARTQIVEDVGKYNIVILDMMYTSDGEDDSPMSLFNGFDLYNALREAEIKENARRAAVRVITALPRNDVSRMVKSCLTVEPPVVFTKGNDWEQLEGCLRDRMDEILKECKRNEDSYLKWIPFPKRGVFHHTGMYEAVTADSNKLQQAVSFARDVVEKKRKMTEEDFALTSSKNPSVVLDHLPAAMAHRRLVIKFLMCGNAPVFFDNENQGGTSYFDEVRYREFLSEYLTDAARVTKLGNSFGKDYLYTKLGFKISKLPDIFRGNRDGILSQNEKDTHFKGRIDLDDYYQFFPGELDSPDEEATPEALLKLLRKAGKVFARAKESGILASEVLLEAGIDAFLAADKTEESLKAVLTGVRDYLSGANEKGHKIALQKIFFAHFDLRDDFPKLYAKVRNASPEIAKLFNNIVDAEF